MSTDEKQFLKRESIRGGMVTLGFQVASTALHFASVITLARFLDPSDYGLLAMVTAFTSFAGLFKDLGLSAAAIQKKQLTAEQQSSLFWINFGVGLTLTVLVAVSSPLVAWFYGKREVASLTLAMSTIFAITAIGTQSGAALSREMKLGRRALANFAGTLAAFLIALLLAWYGFSYWSLVVGQITSAIVTASLLIALAPFFPGPIKAAHGLRELLQFGRHVTFFDLVNYFHRNLDNILVGKVFGEIQLGYYSRAYSLLMLPLRSIRGPLRAVAFPAMSRLDAESDAYRSYYRRITSIIARLTMPIIGMTFACSYPLVEITLGQPWMACAPIYSVLALTAFVQPAASIRGVVMLSSGNSKGYSQWGLLNAVFVSIAFSIGVWWGPIGVAAALGVSNYVLLYPSLSMAFKGTCLRPSDFTESVLRPALTTVLSVAAVFLVSNVFEIPENAALQLIILGAVYWSIFLAVFFLLPGGKSEVRVLVDLAHSAGVWRRPESQPT